VRRFLEDIKTELEEFQSTHPHWVRLVQAIKDAKNIHVSIHAPALGATTCSSSALTASAVSIHAPALGATRKRNKRVRQVDSFNPRTRTGCDAIPGAVSIAPKAVSIHAPALGATKLASYSIVNYLFQSTHPHWVRLELGEWLAIKDAGFNPRTRTGCDKQMATAQG